MGIHIHFHSSKPQNIVMGLSMFTDHMLQKAEWRNREDIWLTCSQFLLVNIFMSLFCITLFQLGACEVYVPCSLGCWSPRFICRTAMIEAAVVQTSYTVLLTLFSSCLFRQSYQAPGVGDCLRQQLGSRLAWALTAGQPSLQSSTSKGLPNTVSRNVPRSRREGETSGEQDAFC